ncbi:MAG: alpha/beta hydrolase [Candidatus Sulfotelmatobacter sp.]
MTSSEDILSLAAPRADARVAYGGDGNQFLDLRLPSGKGPHGLAICIHGGYWRAKYDLEYMGHLCAALTARGIATANLEYRRVGNVGGGWPATFEDVRASYQFLLHSARKYEFDARGVVVMGHSAGGQLGLCLAAHETGVKAVVSLAGVVDLQQAYALHLSDDAVVEFLGGTPAEVADHYREADPMKLEIRTRQWLVHGAEDDVVPPAFSRDYVAAKQKMKEDARLVEIPGTGHFEVVDPRSGAWRAVEKVVMETVG